MSEQLTTDELTLRISLDLAQLVDHGGDRKSTLHQERLNPLPAEVSYTQSHRWQTMAEMPV